MLFNKPLTRCLCILLLNLACFAGSAKPVEESFIKSYSLNTAIAKPVDQQSPYDKAIIDAKKSLSQAQKNNSQTDKIQALATLAKSYA